MTQVRLLCMAFFCALIKSSLDARPRIPAIRNHEWFKGYIPVTLPHHALLHTPRWKGFLLFLHPLAPSSPLDHSERHLTWRRDDENRAGFNPNIITYTTAPSAPIAAAEPQPELVSPKRGVKRKINLIEDVKSRTLFFNCCKFIFIPVPRCCLLSTI